MARMNRQIRIPILIALTAFGMSTRPRSVEVVPAQQADGRPLALWVDALKRRIPEAAWSEVAATPKPLTAGEREWLELIREVSGEWLAGVHRLDAAFPGVSPPSAIRILAGNQGADDGFTHELDTICTDLSDLVRNYGSAREPINRPRVIRILSHEYTHLLTKAWLEQEPWPYESPFLRAIGELYYEGLGNLRSLILSERWITREHELSPLARATIAELEPVMLARLEGLSQDPEPEEARALHANLSAGPFRKKWGALPIALWLAVETRFQPEKIAGWVERGPGGILQLAVKYSQPDNHDAFEALAREVAARTTH